MGWRDGGRGCFKLTANKDGSSGGPLQKDVAARVSKCAISECGWMTSLGRATFKKFVLQVQINDASRVLGVLNP